MKPLTLTLCALLISFCAGCGKANESASGESCSNLLRQIDGAKQFWAEENRKTTNDTPTWEGLRKYFKAVPLRCPNGGTYTIGRVGDLPKCSIPSDDDYFRRAR